MNSQTLHFGDIETNYTYDKATKVKRTADMMKNYLNNIKTEPRMMSQYLSTLKQNGENELFTVYNKMDAGLCLLFLPVPSVGTDQSGHR